MILAKKQDTAALKTCFICHEAMPVEQFYRHPKMADGRLGKCKECTKRQVRENRAKRIEYYTKYEKERALKPHRKKRSAEFCKQWRRDNPEKNNQWRRDNPEKARCHRLVRAALKARLLAPEPCFVCAALPVHAHHPDYNEPLVVVWLCPKCHRMHHDGKLTLLQPGRQA